MVFMLVISYSYAQNDNEFSLIKTPEQKELEAEENDLKFQEYFFKALKERAQDNYDKAIAALDDCNPIYPNHVAVNFEYAKNYYDLKQFDNALAFIHKTLKQKPKEFYVLEMAVKINIKLRNYDEAITFQKKLIALNPDQKNRLVYLYILNKQKDKAREIYAQLEKEKLLDNRKDYYQRILFKKTKSNSIIKNNSENKNSIVLEKKQFYKTKSFKDLKQLLEKEKQLQDYKNLIIDSSEGLSLFPAQPYVYLMNGLALNKENRFKEALESLENGLDYILDENKTLQNKFYKQITIAYNGLGDVKNATKYKNKIIK